MILSEFRKEYIVNHGLTLTFSFKKSFSLVNCRDAGGIANLLRHAIALLNVGSLYVSNCLSIDNLHCCHMS